MDSNLVRVKPLSLRKGRVTTNEGLIGSSLLSETFLF